ncbi:hypothetical protein [Haloferula sp.]|uniref:hypothetical protein n=1 Tax=Haloferula sp. TaxID=2497595 RepID=UPI003C755AEA
MGSGRSWGESIAFGEWWRSLFGKISSIKEESVDGPLILGPAVVLLQDAGGRIGVRWKDELGHCHEPFEVGRFAACSGLR